MSDDRPSPEFLKALADLTAGGRDDVDDEILRAEGKSAKHEIEVAMRERGEKVKWRKPKSKRNRKRKRRR